MVDTTLTWRSAGLFIVGTDTGVGKTVVAAAVASLLADAGRRTGVCKPFASGCPSEAGSLISSDAELLKHFARCPASIDDVSPVRYEKPLAPAVAADGPAPWRRVAEALARLDASSDVMIIEGVGGLLVPLDRDRPQFTVLDLAAAIGYPVLVVAHPSLGTLNHTAMTIRLLRGAGCAIAGVVLNAAAAHAADDASVATNRRWIERMNDVPVLASVPHRGGDALPVDLSSLPRFSDADEQAVIAAREVLRSVHWGAMIGPSRPTAPFPSVPSSPASGSMPS